MSASPLDDFLTLSRANPSGLAPFSVPLMDGGRIEVWDTGVICVEPKPAGQQDQTNNKDIVLSCGLHGDETAPIEMCERLLADIVSGRLPCRQRLLLIFGNLDAINLAVREVEENLNRLFCGAHANGSRHSKERDRAARLELYVSRFYHTRAGAERWHFDLHTAIRPSEHEQFAVYPYLHGAPYSRKLLAFLSHADIHTLLLSHAPAPTFSYFSAHQFGALSLTVELGKVMPFGQNDAQRLVALEQSLARLISRPDWLPPPFALASFHVFQVCQEIKKQSEQFCFHFSNDIANFNTFSPGALLAQDGQHQWRVGAQQEAVVFPNAEVEIGHRTALMVVVTELTDNMLS